MWHALIRPPSPHTSYPVIRALYCSNRWTVTFLDLAANLPKLSTNGTLLEDSGQDYSLATVDGGIGVVAFGVYTVREASAPCCIEGNFSLHFNGVHALDVDLDGNVTARSDGLRAGIEDAIEESKC